MQYVYVFWRVEGEMIAIVWIIGNLYFVSKAYLQKILIMSLQKECFYLNPLNGLNLEAS